MAGTGTAEVCCRWSECQFQCADAKLWKSHMDEHVYPELFKKHTEPEFKCEWKSCLFKTTCFEDLVRHSHYHIYYDTLMLEGDRLMMSLSASCPVKKKLHVIPKLRSNFVCYWDNCTSNFMCIMEFHEHIDQHVLNEWSLMKKHNQTSLKCKWIQCEHQFFKISHALEHLVKHSEKKQLGCSHCGNIYRNPRTFIQHTQAKSQSGVYQCTSCPKSFVSSPMLRMHIKTHTKIYHCEECGLPCKTHYCLTRHVRYRHNKERPIHCTQCSASFVTNSDLKVHIGNKHASPTEIQIKNPKPNRYGCHICNIVYLTCKSLTLHLKKKHHLECPAGYSRFRYVCHADGIRRYANPSEVETTGEELVNANGDDAWINNIAQSVIACHDEFFVLGEEAQSIYFDVPELFT